MVIGSSTQLLTPAPTTEPVVLTLGGSTYTENSASQFIIGGQTLLPGSSITISGNRVSLDSAATEVVIGSSTEALTAASTGVGGLIMGGFGNPEGNVSVFAGGSGRVNENQRDSLILGFLLSLMLLLR